PRRWPPPSTTCWRAGGSGAHRPRGPAGQRRRRAPAGTTGPGRRRRGRPRRLPGLPAGRRGRRTAARRRRGAPLRLPVDRRRAAGLALPDGDDGRLAVRRPLPPVDHEPGYVVLHPGASVPARAWPAGHCREAVELLADAGHRVLVTGGPAERELTAAVAGTRG